MMNTLVIDTPRYIEELEYIISKVNEAKEFWAKCDSTIYRVDRYFKKSFSLFINKELRVGSVLKCMPTYKEDHIVIFLKKKVLMKH